MEHEMLKGFLYAKLGDRSEIKLDRFIEQMTEFFDVEEITEEDVREAVGDLIKEEYVLYGEIDKKIVGTVPDSLTPSDDLNDSNNGGGQ
jgi:hypothetical protein